MDWSESSRPPPRCRRLLLFFGSISGEPAARLRFISLRCQAKGTRKAGVQYRKPLAVAGRRGAGRKDEPWRVYEAIAEFRVSAGVEEFASRRSRAYLFDRRPPNHARSASDEHRKLRRGRTWKGIPSLPSCAGLGESGSKGVPAFSNAAYQVR